MRVLAVTSGRADASPMAPVIKALGEWDIIEVNYEGLHVHECTQELRMQLIFDRPDVVLLLGDRYETLAAALAATVAKVPIAHIHGGEASFGSFDNQIRDAISKLAHIHFVAAEPFKERLIAIGEDPERIHVVGAPGLDNIDLAELGPRKPGKFFVATYHPPTLGESGGIYALIEALDRFPDYNVIWTGVNNDPGNEEIKAALEGHDCRSLGLLDYLVLCRHAAAVVGNSSSGIIEAPTLGVPTVNVGPRQDGRLKGDSVVDCPENAEGIEEGIYLALEYEALRLEDDDLYMGYYHNPYGGPGASQKIADILATAEIEVRKSW
ncbi:hypothetical protein LCGC14_0905130 [marine sediment metagenome]|uniref:UDP-N-acetylglucosamine 2-epimerase domain-containing protein n=1 Tax=marine sediment metagenome TaxID=412755 RepID=A0A0F9REC4_9ZZZZ